MVDSGNLLFKRLEVPKGYSQKKIEADGIIKAYETMGYDAVAVGPFDLAGGIDFLKNTYKRKFPWISANLLRADDTPVFSPSILKNIGDERIGIIGLTNTTASLPNNLHVAPWQEVLPPLVKKLAKQSDHIILLSNLANSENYRIAKDCPGIEIIVTADSRYGNLSPVITANTLITQTASRGKYLGDITVLWGNTGEWKSGHNNQYEILRHRLIVITRQIKELGLQKKDFSPEVRKRLDRLRKSRKRIINQLSQLEGKDSGYRQGRHPSTFSARFIALTSALPDDIETQRIVSNMKHKINKLNKQNSQQTVLEETAASRTRTVQPFTGFKRCATCHPKQTNFWRTTRHARAYASLVTIEQNNNLECLLCHVTHTEELFSQNPADTTSLLSLQPSLQTVGCETCHGAGSVHASDPKTANIIRRPKQKICLHCHTKQRDPHFDYLKKIQLIQCPAD